MRTRVLPAAALFALTVAWPAAADEKKPAKPTLVVRVSSLDGVLGDARYFAELVGKGSEAEQAEKAFKSMAGPKGLAGLDPTKPLGLYGYLGAAGVDSQAVVLLPLADEKAFLQKLESFGLKPEKAEGGLWKLDIDRVPFPVYFRFANNYVYATLRDEEVLGKDRLLDPATVLAGSGTISAVVNLDEIPKELKEIALAQSELRLASAKEQDVPGESKAQKAFRLAALDELYARLKELITDGGPLAVRLDVDRKVGELTLAATLAGKPASKLAAGIAELDKLTSVAAGVVGIAGSDAAVALQVDAALPKNLREAMASAVEEGGRQGLEKEQDEAKRKIAESLLKVVIPTVRMGELDAGVSLRGPDAGGLYTVVGVGKIKDGKALEQTLKDAVKESPVKERGSLSFEFAKVGDVNIHKAVPDKVDENTRNTLGDGPVYFAFRDDALLIAGGSGALDAIKTAATAAPATGKILQLVVSASRVATAKHMSAENKQAPAIAKRVFKGGDDAIRVTLEGGAALKLSLNLKAQVVKFFAELGEAKKGE
jgi:hypothetical protein